MLKPHTLGLLMTNAMRMMSHRDWVAYTHDVFHCAAGAGTVLYHNASVAEHGDENYCIILSIPPIEIEPFREQLTAIRKNSNGSRLSLFHNEPTYV